MELSKEPICFFIAATTFFFGALLFFTLTALMIFITSAVFAASAVGVMAFWICAFRHDFSPHKLYFVYTTTMLISKYFSIKLCFYSSANSLTGSP